MPRQWSGQVTLAHTGHQEKKPAWKFWGGRWDTQAFFFFSALHLGTALVDRVDNADHADLVDLSDLVHLADLSAPVDAVFFVDAAFLVDLVAPVDLDRVDLAHKVEVIVQP